MFMHDVAMDHEDFAESRDNDLLFEGEGSGLLPSSKSPSQRSSKRKKKAKRSPSRPGGDKKGGKNLRSSANLLKKAKKDDGGGLGLPGQAESRARSAMRSSQQVGSALKAVQPVKRNQFLVPGAGTGFDPEHSGRRNPNFDSSNTAILDAAQDFPSQDDDEY